MFMSVMILEHLIENFDFKNLLSIESKSFFY